MKRTLALGAAWTAAAAVAVGLGFLAVSLVDASASSGTQPVAATSSATSPPAAASSTSPSVTGAPGPVPGPDPATPGVTLEQVTVGGTVLAGCTDGLPVLASAPSPGWWVDDSSDRHEVEFEDGATKVEVDVSCAGGSPLFSVEGPRADSSSRPASPTSASSGDDSDGRRGGGHGSDD
ncbi:MAG: hypothetical protein JWR62_2068 [Modestobacter sp.]|jgi:hypothetical protein|nr:hypothetical protein [Modestobacter sp.]